MVVILRGKFPLLGFKGDRRPCQYTFFAIIMMRIRTFEMHTVCYRYFYNLHMVVLFTRGVQEATKNA
jgi:hypothetical protein